MRVGQIHDMNVVAKAGAIGRGVILAEDVDRRSPSRRLYRARNHVDLGGVILTEFSIRIGASRVEVSQADRRMP